eukprot:c3022_g1_i1.p1 GENE.c3022_g1_i1~~c3022_g1_i1.p1  ORF type:complete len:238 (-),score=40.21 c3022_g1_i1:10-723(-)
MIFVGDARVKTDVPSIFTNGISIHSSNGVTVNAGEVLEVPVIVSEDSRLFFIFNTADSGTDIDFEIIQASGGASLIPVERCQRKQGEIDVGPGSYCLRWSNEHSWMTAKSVMYAIFIASKESIKQEKDRLRAEKIEKARRERLVWAEQRLQQLHTAVAQHEQVLTQSQQQRQVIADTISELCETIHSLQADLALLDGRTQESVTSLTTIREEAEMLLTFVEKESLSLADTTESSDSL